MPMYRCPRCNYETKIKTHMRKHFNRRNPCTIVNNAISIADCVCNILGEKVKIESKLNPYNQKLNPIESKLNPIESKPVIIESKLNPNGHNYNHNSLRRDNILLQSVSFQNSTTCRSKIFKCNKCKKTYSTNSNLHKHMKNCNHKDLRTYSKQEVEYLLEKRLDEQQKQFHDKLEDKEKMILELTRQVEKLIEKVGNTTYNTYNIVINPFGKENTSYISADYVSNLISDGPYNSIPKLLKYIHFHPEHKENHNIKIPNKKQPYAQVYNGTDWEYQLKKDTIEAMSDRAYSILNKHFRGDNEYMTRFKSDYNENTAELSKRLNRDIEVTILNNQQSIINNQNTVVNTQSSFINNLPIIVNNQKSIINN